MTAPESQVMGLGGTQIPSPLTPETDTFETRAHTQTQTQTQAQAPDRAAPEERRAIGISTEKEAVFPRTAEHDRAIAAPMPMLKEPEHAALGDDSNNTNLSQTQQQPVTEPKMAAMHQNEQKVTELRDLQDFPQLVHCPFCKETAMSKVVQEGQAMQAVAGALLCVFCVCLTCLPCVSHWFENTTWFCSKCHKKIAFRANHQGITTYGLRENGQFVMARFP